MKILSACLVWLIASLPTYAIEGRYRVEGSNPGQTQGYRGAAIVKKTGETFSIVWQLGSSRLIGTGVRTGSVLSVVFQNVGSPGGGVASFDIVDDKIATGHWAATGGQAVGSEKWSAEIGP